MQERIKIQTQLESMREDCIRDYLSTKLQSIASKEVVNDILLGFIEANNKEFLENITESILEAKNHNKKLKETIESMKKDSELGVTIQLQRVKDDLKQSHYAEMTQLKEEFNSIKLSLEEQAHRNGKHIQALNQELNTQKNENQQLKSAIKQKTSQINNLHCQIGNSEQKAAQLIQKIRLLIVKQSQFQKQSQRQIQLLRSQHEQKLLLFREQLQIEKRDILRQSNEVAKQYESRLEAQNIKIFDLLQQIKDYDLSFKRLKDCQHEGEINILQNEKEMELLTRKFVEAEQLIAQKDNQIKLITESRKNCVQENGLLLKRMQILQHNFFEEKNRCNQQIEKLFTTVQQSKQLNQNLSKEKSILEDRVEQKNQELLAAIKRHLEQISFLNFQKSRQDQKYQALEFKIEAETQKVLACHEEIKSLIQYNSLQQEQIVKYEHEITDIKEECRAEIATYQDTLILNINALQEELGNSKKQKQQLKSKVCELSDRLLHEQQKQKCYELYLEEIAFLKNELSKYQASYNKAIKQAAKALRSRVIEQNLRETVEKVSYLSSQNRKLKAFIMDEISQMSIYFKQSIRYLISEVQSHSMKCFYCEHEKTVLEKTRSPPKGFMEKTLPRASLEVQSIGSIKRNLKSIQEKYQQLNHENQSFANRVDSILNKN